MSGSPASLTPFQKMRMEENRRKALQKRKTSHEPAPSTEAPHPAKKAVVRTPLVKLDFILSSQDGFRVTFHPFDDQVISVFKSLSSAQYSAGHRLWSFSIKDHDNLVGCLRSLPNKEINPLPPWIIRTFIKPKDYMDHDLEEQINESIEPHLLSSLMPFQKEGLRYSLRRQGRVLIADDMGLGKTIQALAVANFYSSEWPLIIVAPSSVKYNWKSAILRWIPSLIDSDVLIISTGQTPIQDERAIILSYDMLSKKIKELTAKSFQVAILDESHLLKNYKSARCVSAVKVLEMTRRVILLSGTPALSRPMELYTQISLIDPHLFKYPMDYGMRYCNGKKTSLGRTGKDFFDFSGSSNMEELNLLLSERCMIRRLKSDVLKELPSKQRQMILLDPSSVKTNSKSMKQHAANIISQSLTGVERRGELLEWFNTTSIAKEKAVKEYIKDLLESQDKFIVFAHHQNMIKSLEGLCNKDGIGYMVIDGKTSSDARKTRVDKFQTSKDCRIALLSITAANAGITLTSANLVVFAELFWNPGILTQAEDRVHRIGQSNSVTIQYLVAKGTADDELWPMIQKKLDVLGKAGLTKDNFSDSSTTSKQFTSAENKITDYFSTSFTDEDFDSLFDGEIV